MSKRDIDLVIAEARRLVPELRVEQLNVRHPGTDDDGLWFFSVPGRDFEIQLESSTGSFPFLAESDSNERRQVRSLGEAIELIDRWLRPGDGSELGQAL